MKDPLQDVDVEVRRTVLILLAIVLGLVAWAISSPSSVAVVAVILTLPLIIMLHELGHFVTAKRAGMKVTEFFIGFGPRVWSVKRGETEYGIKPFVLGGYCKIVGMTNLDDVAADDEPRTYRSKRWRSKVMVAAAGPVVHFVIAVVLMFAVIGIGGDFRNAKALTTLAAVTQGAQQAGLRPGDRLVAIDGVRIQRWDDVRPVIDGPNGHRHEAGDVVHFVVARDGRLVEKDVKLGRHTEGGTTRIVAGIVARLHVPRPGLVGAIVKAPAEVVEVAGDSLQALGKTFSPSGIASYIRTVAGDTGKGRDDTRFISPYGFAKLASDAVRSGWVDTLGLLIAINVFVGLFNLVPLLPFDGGYIAIATYEKLASIVRRRRVQVDVAKLLPITFAVVAVLGFIFLSSLFLDIARPVSNPF